MTPAAQQRRAALAAKDRAPAGPEDLNSNTRCITPGVPRIGGVGADPLYGYYQIVQGPGYVVVVMETFHDARIIPLDGRPHLPQSIRQWSGDSRGRWEGATLVVDTTNFAATSNFLGSGDRLHLVERFTRVSPDTIDYEVTADDPTTWTKPWTVLVHLKQMSVEIYEYACHEGNAHSMQAILAGARADERAVRELTWHFRLHHSGGPRPSVGAGAGFDWKGTDHVDNTTKVCASWWTGRRGRPRLGETRSCPRFDPDRESERQRGERLFCGLGDWRCDQGRVVP